MTTENDKPKRQNIIGYKGMKIFYPENRNKSDNDIFNNKQFQNKVSLNLKTAAEAKIDNEMRSKSPFFNGHRNIDYIPPQSQTNLFISDTKTYKYNKSITPKANNNKVIYNILNNKEVKEREVCKTPNSEDRSVPIFGGGRRIIFKAISANLSRDETNTSLDFARYIKTDNNDKSVNDSSLNNIIRKCLTNNQDEPLKTEDELRNYKQKIIKDKIKQRENLSEQASKNIINERENEKNKLQENYEKETFIFHDRAKVNNHNMNTNEKIKKKEIIHDGYLNKFMLKPFNYLE